MLANPLLGKRRKDHGDRGRFEAVFVVTFGRSGSTLAQGLLNTLPATVVRGENNLFVLSLFRAQAAAESFRAIHLKHDTDRASSAFFGLDLVVPDAFVRAARDLLTEVLLGPEDPREIDRIGFKEVLWHKIKSAEAESFFAFLDDVFPGAKYVLNQRAHDDVATSGFWRSQDDEEVRTSIARVEDIQGFLRETRPDRVFDMRYERVTSTDRAESDAELRALATFVLGSCSDELLVQLRATLATGHGPRPFGKSRRRDARRAKSADTTP